MLLKGSQNNQTFTADVSQPWMDLNYCYFEYLVICFNYFIISFQYSIIG